MPIRTIGHHTSLLATGCSDEYLDHPPYEGSMLSGLATENKPATTGRGGHMTGPGTQGPRSFDEQIAALSDQQALAIVDAIAGEHAEQDTPAGEREQAEALHAAFVAIGDPIDPGRAVEADSAAAGRVARELLRIMAGFPELRTTVDEWLDKPPRQEAAAVPLILAAPAVFAGCIALLYVVGHSRFRRNASGKWEFEYAPTPETPMDRTLKEAVKTMAGLMRSLIPT